MKRRRRVTSPLRVMVLSVLIAVGLYVNFVIMPTVPPLFVPTPTPTLPPETYISDAQTLESEGKYNQAIQAYEEAIRVDPKNMNNYISLARLHTYLASYEEAVENAEKALMINQSSAVAHALRGYALGKLGDYLEAEAALEAAIELEPNNYLPYALLAEITANKYETGIGDQTTLDEAIELSHKARELNANALETHRARAIILELTGSWNDGQNIEQAAQEYQAAISINPNIASLHLGLGRVYRTMQVLPKALEEFNRAVALNPTDPWGYSYLSTTYAANGEFVRAIQFGLKAVEQDPANPYWRGNLGQLYYRQKQYLDARKHLTLAVKGGMSDEGVEVTPVSPNGVREVGYYSSFGLTMANLGECGEALEISQLLLQNYSNDEVTAFNAQEMVNICQSILENGTPTPPAVETHPAEEEVGGESGAAGG